MTMVDLMLNDLRHPARIGSMLLFKVLIQIVHFDFFISCTGSHTIQGQTSFFCLKYLFLFGDYRIDHGKLKGTHCHNNDIFSDTDHIRCHSNASIQIRPERIQKIQYPMLADPTHALARDFEVYIEAEGVAERGTFVVNPEGKIVAYEVNAGNVGRNADELLRKVQACQFVHEHGDEVCPAKWQPGAETLKPSLDLVGML